VRLSFLVVFKAMMLTGQDLLSDYQSITTVYMHGDEISLVIPYTQDKPQKLLSKVSGFCAARFNHHIAAQDFDNLVRDHRLVVLEW
jgi:tRNA(His) 5'-end guanylyltransferase